MNKYVYTKVKGLHHDHMAYHTLVTHISPQIIISYHFFLLSIHY